MTTPPLPLPSIHAKAPLLPPQTVRLSLPILTIQLPPLLVLMALLLLELLCHTCARVASVGVDIGEESTVTGRILLPLLGLGGLILGVVGVKLVVIVTWKW